MAAALKIADLPHSKMIDLISLDGAGYGQPPSLRSERRPVPRLRIRQLGHADAVIRAPLKPQIQPELLGMMRKPQFFHIPLIFFVTTWERRSLRQTSPVI